MKIIISNKANVSNKHLRFIKWKIRNIKEKFQHLLYLEAYISYEGQRRQKIYKGTLKLGVPGNDIVLVNQSQKLTELWSKSFQDVQRYLRKHKEKSSTKN